MSRRNYTEVRETAVDVLLDASLGLGGVIPAASAARRVAAGGSTPPNPHFVDNGIEGGSPRTKRYLNRRRWKVFGGKAIALVGKVASAGTAGVNIGKAGRDTRSTAKTIGHLTRLESLSAGVKDGGSLAEQLRIIRTLKQAKLARRGVGAASAFVPGGGLVHGGVRLATGIVKANYAAAVKQCAADLHWRAYREGVVAGRQSAVGPANRILEELFAQAFAAEPGPEAQERAHGFVNEPAGWLVFADKIGML